MKNISKTTFCKAIRSVVDMEEFYRSLYDLGLTIDDTCPFFKTIDSIVDILEDAFDNDIVSWWIWDAPEAGKDEDSVYIEVDGKKHYLYTPEDLYDFLVFYDNGNRRDPDERLHNGG